MSLKKKPKLPKMKNLEIQIIKCNWALDILHVVMQSYDNNDLAAQSVSDVDACLMYELQGQGSIWYLLLMHFLFILIGIVYGLLIMLGAIGFNYAKVPLLIQVIP